MAGTTARGFPFPDGSDPINNGDDRIRLLASFLDANAAFDAQGSYSSLPTSTPAQPGTRGRYFYATDLGYLLRDNGMGWDLVNGASIGDVVDTLRTSDPPGGYYLLADGRSITRANYPALSAIVGGTGPTIDLYDLRGRSTAMPNGGQTGTTRIAVTAGAVVGETSHVLTVDEIPAHTHAGQVDNDGPFAQGSNRGISDGSGTDWDSGSGNGRTRSTGGGQAHNTVHPVVGLNKLVRVR